MRRVFLWFVLALVLPMVAPAQTVTSGTLTMTTTGSPVSTYTVNLTWTSDAGGNVVASGIELTGLIHRLVFVDGDPAPTAAYDATLTDVDGYDVLETNGGNVGASPDVTLYATPEPVFNKHSLTIQNAGASKTGTIRIYMRR